MNDTKAAKCMRVLAPSVALVSGLSVFRGYAQGYSNMTPSSVSQIIEALFKLIVGLTLAWYFIRVLGKPDYIGAAAPSQASPSPSLPPCSTWPGTICAPGVTPLRPSLRSGRTAPSTF